MMDTPLAPNASPRRIMAIWCRMLALDRWRQAEGCTPGEGPDAEALVLTQEGDGRIREHRSPGWGKLE